MVIKVFDNGVPLSAIVSVEFRERVSFPYAMCWPRLKLPLPEAEVRRLRDEWLAAWPEVADFLPKR